MSSWGAAPARRDMRLSCRPLSLRGEAVAQTPAVVGDDNGSRDRLPAEVVRRPPLARISGCARFSFRLVAVVFAAVPRAPARDEDEASADARSAPASLLHP